MTQIITQAAIANRSYWVEEIRKLSGNFSNDTERLEKELSAEIKKQGGQSLIDHLRLCGSIPESYAHDSSEEKVYSKYTDSLLAESYRYMGMTSIVLKERGDAADVEVVASQYSFIADAKSFRLSRTAKNQKDFKVTAMDGWKRGKPHAMVVCPIYQLPSKSSQIYEQASSKNVCVFTYSHLAILVAFAEITGKEQAQKLLLEVFKTVQALNPSKDASVYWQSINRGIIGFSKEIEQFWEVEKKAALESIKISKEEALTFLAQEREKIMNMNHDEAISELVKVHKIQSRIDQINSVSDNKILQIR